MLIVGPNQQCAPLAMHSFPSSSPARTSKSLFQVAPNAEPQGIHAAETPAMNFVPRIPLGPSVTRMAGMLNSSNPFVCQKSEPNEEHGLVGANFHRIFNCVPDSNCHF